MKTALTIVAFLLLQTSYGQTFHLKYWWTGLGSNAHVWNFFPEQKACAEGFQVEINGTTLTVSDCRRTDEYYIDSLFKDTIWTMERYSKNITITQTAIDSIVTALDTLQGKSVYLTNPNIMSGGIDNFYIKSGDWCTQFTMKNTFDSTAAQITRIINPYLHGYGRIYIPQGRWMNNEYNHPLISPCSGARNATYREALEQDYDVIKNAGKQD